MPAQPTPQEIAARPSDEVECPLKGEALSRSAAIHAEIQRIVGEKGLIPVTRLLNELDALYAAALEAATPTAEEPTAPVNGMQRAQDDVAFLREYVCGSPNHEGVVCSKDRQDRKTWCSGCLALGSISDFLVTLTAPALPPQEPSR